MRSRATAWPARLVLLGAIWGMSFALIKVGNRGFTPVQVSFGRMLFGLLTLTPVLLAQRGRLPRDVDRPVHAVQHKRKSPAAHVGPPGTGGVTGY